MWHAAITKQFVATHVARFARSKIVQTRNVTWPGARSKFDVPKFEPEVFRQQIYCIEESNCDIVGTFRRRPQ